MSSTLTIDDLLGHVSKQIALIDRVTADMIEADFLEDEIAQTVVVKCIENMGEASRLLRENHQSFIEQETSINWKGLIAMRNVLTHKYFFIDYELVWNTVQTDIRSIAEALRQIADAQCLAQQLALLANSRTR